MVSLQEPLVKYRKSAIPLISLVVGILCLFAPHPLRSQDDLNIHGVVSDAMSQAKLSGVEVKAMKDGKVQDTYTTRGNGKYEFYLNCGAHYVFTFEKAGFVKRSIEIDSRNIPPEVIGAGIIMPTDMSMFAITPAMENEDLSVFDKPIGKASYDPSQADLVWDFAYTQKVKSEINGFIRNLGKKKVELTPEEIAKAAAEEEYKKRMADGDAAMSSNNYQDAVDQFKGALDAKPGDQLAQQKLGSAESKRNEELEEERMANAYSAAISAGDKQLKNEEFEAAIASFEEALAAKRGDAYAQSQIKEANRLMVEKADEIARRKEYEAHMKEGDDAVASSAFEKAISAYGKALETVPGDRDASKKRSAAEEALADQKANEAREAEYAALIKQADDHFAKENFKQAKSTYQEALGLKSNDTYASGKVEACEAALAAIEAAEANKKAFDDFMAQGEQALGAADYAKAVNAFESAMGVYNSGGGDPKDKEAAQSKYKEASDLLAEAEAEKKKRADYDRLVADADKSFGREDYNEAKALYTEARNLIAEETYPMDQLQKIKTILAEQEAQAQADAAYAEAMEKGRSAASGQKYDEAIARFDEALGLRAGDKDATTAREDAVRDKAAMEEAQAEQAAYDAQIATADGKRDGGQLAEAIAAYEEAQRIKPDESYPGQQIADLQERIAQREAEAAEAERQAALQADFDAAIAAGDQAMGESLYEKAIGHYGDALSVFADNAKAANKKAEAQEKLDAQRAQAQLDEDYAATIADADGKMGRENYEEAKTAYKEARKLKPDEAYPGEQLALIEERLAAMAKAEAEAELKLLNEQVTALLLEGDQLVKKQEFEDGIGKYEAAQQLLPDRADISKKIADAEAAQLAWLEAQATDDAYAGVLAKADEAFADDRLDAAKRGYLQASDIKPDEAYPKTQLELIAEREKEAAEAEAAALAERDAQIAALVAEGDQAVGQEQFDNGIGKYEEALALDDTRSDVRKKISDAEAAQLAWLENQATAEAYDGIIASADAAFDREDWEGAKRKYEQAIDVKPDEAYPKERMKEIDSRMAAADAAAEAARNAEIEALIAEGDAAVDQKQFDRGISKYEDALERAPGRKDVAEKLKNAQDALMDSLESEALEEAYAEAIAKADKAYKKQDWSVAKRQYEDALEIKSNEPYPAAQLADITDRLAALAEDEAAREALEVQRQFDAYISSGDKDFGKRKYEEALVKYENALALQPDSELALEKIAEVNKAMGELDAAASERKAYDDAIADGDDFFSDGDYEMSKMRYEDALAIKAGEKYPTKRIVEIDKLLEQQNLREANEAAEALDRRYNKAIQNADAAMGRTDYDEAISTYEEALEIKPNENYPKGQIERARLLMKEAEAEAERRAAEREAAQSKKQSRQQDDYRTVSTRSEEQAETFMRDALEAQEREKYERIKKLKEENFMQQTEWRAASDAKREMSYEELFVYELSNQQIFERGMERYEERSNNSVRYKRTLLENMQRKATAARVREKAEYERIKQDAAGIRDLHHTLHTQDMENLREVAREMRLFTEEYGNYYRKKNEEMVASNTAKSRQQQETFDTQLDDKKTLADIQRSKNLEEAYAKMQGNAKAHTEFFRMALAMEYPQGVTEESSTLGNKVIITRIVVHGSKGDEYRKVLDRAGNYYFKNGQSISEITWNRETLDAFYGKD